MIPAVLALMLPAIAPVASAQQQPPSITKRQIREDLPYRTDRRLRNQLWSVFGKTDRRRPVPPRAVLDREWLEGQSYATAHPGLCRRDTVVLRFAPVGTARRSADAATPVAAYGIDATRRYRVVSSPAADGQPDYERSPWDASCRGLTDDGFFSASDDDTANGGYRALLAAIDAAKRGIAIVPCARLRFDTRGCADMIAGYDPQSIQSVEGCGDDCFLIDIADDRRLTIRRARDGSVQSIGFDSPIVMVHELID